VGWAALDFWNMPARRSSAPEGVLDLQSWTIVPYEYLARPDLVQHQVRVSGDSKVEILARMRRTPALAPSSLAEPDRRLEAIAAAGDDAAALPTAVAAEQEMGDRHSFLELERRYVPAAERASSARAEPLASDTDRVDPGTAEVQPTSASVASGAGLKSLRSGTVVQGRPVAIRPLVRSEQDGIVGVSERWKAIYHSVGQPRPTQFQNVPVQSSPVALDDLDDDGSRSSVPPRDPESSMRRPTERKRGERAP
jgi:hypothetical protein